ncbi:MAG: hypothetical protein WCD81_04485 [Candidatus Bathyarchaeia archaeon]
MAETKEEEHKLVFVFDNTFLDFIYCKQLDLKILDLIRTVFDLTLGNLDLMIVTDKVHDKMVKKYAYPYGDEFDRMHKNWVNLAERLYGNSEVFCQHYETKKRFWERAFGCCRTHFASEDVDLITSAALLKQKQFNPVIVSDDSRLIYFSDIMSSYFGFYFRSFSTFELLSYLGTPKCRRELFLSKNHFDLGMSLASLNDKRGITNCQSLVEDLKAATRKGVFSTHYCSAKFPQTV